MAVFEVLKILGPGRYEIIAIQILKSTCTRTAITAYDRDFVDDLKYLEGQDKPA